MHRDAPLSEDDASKFHNNNNKAAKKASAKKEAAVSRLSRMSHASKKVPHHCRLCGSRDLYYDLAHHLMSHKDIYKPGTSTHAYFFVCDE